MYCNLFTLLLSLLFNTNPRILRAAIRFLWILNVFFLVYNSSDHNCLNSVSLYWWLLKHQVLTGLETLDPELDDYVDEHIVTAFVSYSLSSIYLGKTATHIFTCLECPTGARQCLKSLPISKYCHASLRKFYPANTQRRYNVAATSRSCSEVVTTLLWRCMVTG